MYEYRPRQVRCTWYSVGCQIWYLPGTTLGYVRVLLRGSQLIDLIMADCGRLRGGLPSTGWCFNAVPDPFIHGDHPCIIHWLVSPMPSGQVVHKVVQTLVTTTFAPNIAYSSCSPTTHTPYIHPSQLITPSPRIGVLPNIVASRWPTPLSALDASSRTDLIAS